jgi:hypothetical protein
LPHGKTKDTACDWIIDPADFVGGADLGILAFGGGDTQYPDLSNANAAPHAGWRDILSWLFHLTDLLCKPLHE